MKWKINIIGLDIPRDLYQSTQIIWKENILQSSQFDIQIDNHRSRYYSIQKSSSNDDDWLLVRELLIISIKVRFCKIRTNNNYTHLTHSINMRINS